ncbi:uncharacterized protein LOC106738204 [Alligator mississippiensis]|uniref:Uncharacterized protein n=1 Tax=Alligator mississippiensis TaxID=8496 RepID=A0A151M3S6_ALLMI|nr:uncharacterized protein LOC106738204 [Alligator mississippiensis]XP_059570324.1 uncharacterized protein LOC106738204 [Alligator mississippiensis]KYO19146.1 hypothetical protein Y1Q_0008562 [Alligator mississippiensis]
MCLKPQKEPLKLSIESLRKVQAQLESKRLMTPMLRRCFELALKQFPQEPQCVQDNAQMVIASQMMELKFVSGEGECKIKVSSAEGCPQYKVGEPTKSMYLDRLLHQPQLLTTENLKNIKKTLETWGSLSEEMELCFEEVLKEFPQETLCVRSNAYLVIHCDGMELRFVSGERKCEIAVCSSEPRYRVKELTAEVFLERLLSRPQRLSMENLQRIRKGLASWTEISTELRACFNLFLEKFPNEPACIQEIPTMNMKWDGTRLQFLEGDLTVTVTWLNDKATYNVQVKTWAIYQEMLKLSEQPLSKENLLMVRQKVRNLQGVPDKVEDVFNMAIEKFFAEQEVLQNNAKLVMKCDVGEIVFVSGKGENIVDVYLSDGKVYYKNLQETTEVKFLKTLMDIISSLWEALINNMVKRFSEFLELLPTIGKYMVKHFPEFLKLLPLIGKYM